jgi:branched-chain amino acid transport system ATP-binding protein
VTALLEVDAARAGYGTGGDVLHGVSLHVAPGEVVAIAGANGAGKSTVARLVTGMLVATGRGRLRAGSVRFDGSDVAGLDAAALVRRGIGQVLEGRRVFKSLSVEDNLRAAAYRAGPDTLARREQLLATFPALVARRRTLAGNLSGGEQQMLATARALVRSPRLLVLDEPTLGLAPAVAAQVLSLVADIAAAGTAVLLIEQNLPAAARLAERAYVLQRGRVAWIGPGHELVDAEGVRDAYLGTGDRS